MKITKYFIALIVICFAFSCKKSEDPAPAPVPVVEVPEIGKIYQGCIVFYLDSTGEHGLSASRTDMSVNAEWGCEGTLITANGTARGTGQANTSAILSGCATTGIAARVCSNLGSGWFMPSKDDLNLMYTNLHLNSTGGFTNSYYWSSTEEDANKAWFQFFGNGLQSTYGKHFQFYVRAIRAF